MSWLKKDILAEPRRILEWAYPGLGFLDFNKVTVKNDKRILFYSEANVHSGIMNELRMYYAVWVASYGEKMRTEHYSRPGEVTPPELGSKIDGLYKDRIWTFGEGNYIIQLRSESTSGREPLDILISRNRENLDALLKVVYGIEKPAVQVENPAKISSRGGDVIET